MSTEPVRHLERVEWKPRRGYDATGWPFTVPAVAQLIADGGLDIPAGVTLLVGENGSGKSTLLEAVAAVYPRRGVAGALIGSQGSDEDSPLRWHLKARTNPLASFAGFFLRAEVMHEYFAKLDADPLQRGHWGGRPLNAQSHGESYLQVLRTRFAEIGVYFLDEPESALSFQSCLGLLALLDLMRREGSQVIVATHSPVLASLPDATLLEVGDWGIRQTTYDDLELVQSWRSFLDAPGRWLRHLVDQEENEEEPAG